MIGLLALDQSASLILMVSTGTEKRMLAHIFLQGSQEHDACINHQAGRQWQSFEGELVLANVTDQSCSALVLMQDDVLLSRSDDQKDLGISRKPAY